jgi:hypothetical protein
MDGLLRQRYAVLSSLMFGHPMQRLPFHRINLVAMPEEIVRPE